MDPSKSPIASAPAMINALVTTFPGLPSLALPLPSSTPISTLHNLIATRLSIPSNLSLHLSTTRGTLLCPISCDAVSTLIPGSSNLLPLRLLPTLSGGKGGFGSQLRAAGGRMSSRKRRGQEENSDSCRNLDGRRIRTVKEAKALAAYLEIKPDMDRKEREKRQERWRRVVELADRREAEEKGGVILGGKRFEDTEWLEKSEEEKEKMREAVLKAMKEGAIKEKRSESPGSSGSSSGMDEGNEEEEMVTKVLPAVPKLPEPRVNVNAAPKFAGFDDDDEFMSEDDEDAAMSDIAEEDEEEEEVVLEGKGKGKAK